MTLYEQIATIAILAAVTALTRFLPFFIFPPGKPTPAYIRYLGDVLPLAVFGMLLVYCVKDVEWTGVTHGIPEILGIAICLAVHAWCKQMFLSMAAGTIAYMLVSRIFL